MLRFLFLSAILFCSSARAGDILHYVCVGNDSNYKVAALQQVLIEDHGTIMSTFVLDLAASTNVYMTRYSQKGDLIFRPAPVTQEGSIVAGSFENGGKEVGMSILYSMTEGYRIELAVDRRIVKMPCDKKI